MKFKTLMLLPIRVELNTDKLEPRRAMDLKLKVEPRYAASSKLKTLP